MVMKVVNDKNLSVEQLIMALAEREQVLYDNWKELEETLGDDYIETLEKRNEWETIYLFMQEMIIGVENTESVGSVEV
jgi:hypothetical protein